MLNPAFLMDLIRARVLLADDGLVGSTGWMGPTADLAQLPGGAIVRVFMDGSAILVGIAHPSGDAAVPPRRVDHPLDFAAIMSTIDVMMADGLSPAAAGVPALADALVWTIRHNALPIRLPLGIDIGQPDGPWSPSPEARDLLKQIVDQAPVLRRAATDFLDGRPAAAVGPTHWLDQLDDWLLQDGGLVDAVIPGDGMRWRRIRTTAGLAAALARCSRRPRSPEFSHLQAVLSTRMQHPSPMLSDRTMVYELLLDRDVGVLVAGLTPRQQLVAAGHVGSEWAGEALELLQRSLGLAGHHG